MSQVELLKAATPGKWSHGYIYGGLRHLDRNVDFETFCPDDELQRIFDDELNYPQKNDAELLRQAKVNALLVECVLSGYELGCDRNEQDEIVSWVVKQTWEGRDLYDHVWHGPLHDMDEETFQQILAELDKA